MSADAPHLGPPGDPPAAKPATSPKSTAKPQKAQTDNFAKYKAALEQEFELNKDNDIAKKAERSLLEALPVAIEQLVHIMQHGESDRVRFNAATYVVDRNLGPLNKLGVRDESMNDMIKSLNKASS